MPDKKPWEEYAEAKKRTDELDKPKPKAPSMMDRAGALMKGLMGSRDPKETNLGSGLLGKTKDTILERNRRLEEEMKKR